MLEALFGNNTIEKVLFYINVYGDGYGNKISRTFNLPLISVQKQLQRLEEGNILVSHMKGRTRLYTFNPRYVFLEELKKLLNKAIRMLPEKEVKKYYRQRTRPRKAGKPWDLNKK